MSANLKVAQDKWEHAWRGFAPGIWRDRVNTRDFIQRSYTPYEGDGSFLKGPTPRTTKMWETLGPLFAKEREKGVLDVSQVPSSILAHAPGYIDKANEIIVGRRELAQGCDGSAHQREGLLHQVLTSREGAARAYQK